MEVAQPRIQPAQGKQLRVRARLSHATVFDHEQTVCLANGRQPMRDRDRRPSLHECFEGALDLFFANIPQVASSTQITRLEEEKIYGYFGAGTLYATWRRAEPLL